MAGFNTPCLKLNLPYHNTKVRAAKQQHQHNKHILEVLPLHVILLTSVNNPKHEDKSANHLPDPIEQNLTVSGFHIVYMRRVPETSIDYITHILHRNTPMKAPHS